MFGQKLLLKQYHKVYRYDNWMRRHFTVTGHLVVLMMIASMVFGIDTGHSTTYQLFVFLAVILVFALLNSVFNRLKVDFKRVLPRYGTVGETLTYTVKLTNLTKKDYDKLGFIELLDETLPTYSQLKDFYQLNSLAWFKRGVSFRHWRRYLHTQRGGMIAEMPLNTLKQQSLEVKISFTPVRRGMIKFSKAYLAKPDLLGVFRRLLVLEQQQSCLILPPRYPMKPLALAGKRKYQAGGVSLANSVGNSSEFMSLRDYQQGDPLNSIHWKSYAKHGKLIVKEYQDEYFVRRALLLDTFIGEAKREQFEAAVSVAASVAMSERQNDALLDLMFVGLETYCFTSGRGVDHLPHLQEILATVQASDEASFDKLQQAVLAHAGQCSSFVCVFMQWDAARQQLIKQLLANGLPVAVFVLHDGSMNLASINFRPEFFYLIDYQHLEKELAAI